MGMNGIPRKFKVIENATSQGWVDFPSRNPAPANALIKRDNAEMSDGLIASAIDKMKRYGIANSGEAASRGLGTMTEARWKMFFETMSSEGLYPANLPYRAAFDLRFVEAGGLAKPLQSGK